MSHGKRFFDNKFQDILPGQQYELDATGKLPAPILSDVARIYQNCLSILEKNLIVNMKDPSVYTGNAGIAYLYLTLSEKEGSVRTDLLAKGLQFAEKSLIALRKRDISFLCGDSGPLAITAALRKKSGFEESARECVAAIMEFLPRVLDLNSDLADELLYGRVGFLYSLLFIENYIPGSVPRAAIKEIADAVLKSGQNLSRYKKFPAPLLWEWYDELYVGGAHGVAGILYLLLQVKEVLSAEKLEDIRQTIDYLLSIKYSSGNFPSSIGSTDDRLVHWCHGAPGIVQLLLTAFNVWKVEKYLKAAKECGEVVWQRGLLKKGYGICHGVAGNAYTFLALYQVTRSDKYLHRAVQFARWCDTYDLNQERPPDRPFSLFEGLAGTVYFLKDIQDPLNAAFPAFSLKPFK